MASGWSAEARSRSEQLPLVARAIQGQLVPLHVPLMQGVPCVQHGSPLPPQDWHELFVPADTQLVWSSVHVLPEQHGCAMPPQISQNELLVHTCWLLPTCEQAAPEATHVGIAPVVPVSQQPFASH